MLAQLLDGRMIVACDLIGQRQVARIEDARLRTEEAAAGARPPRWPAASRSARAASRRAAGCAARDPSGRQSERRAAHAIDAGIERRQSAGIDEFGSRHGVHHAGRRSADWRGRGVGKPAAAQPERDVHEQDQHRHFDQRPDDGGEGDRRGEAEGGDGDRDRQLEIVAGRGEGDRRGARIVGRDQLAHREADDELDDEIDASAAWRSAARPSGRRTTSPPFRLNMATMVNSSAASVIGLMRGRKTPLVPVLALALAIRTRRVR